MLLKATVGHLSRVVSFLDRDDFLSATRVSKAGTPHAHAPAPAPVAHPTWQYAQALKETSYAPKDAPEAETAQAVTWSLTGRVGRCSSAIRLGRGAGRSRC